MTSDEVKFCIRCGTELGSKEWGGRVRPACPNCGWVYFADPKVAVSVLVEQDGAVLLVQRKMKPRRGFWTLPGGFMDAGEDPAAAAARECLEETGLVVAVGDLIQYNAGREHQRGADLVLIFAAKVVGGQLQAGDDAGQAVFFQRNALPELAFTATQQVLIIGD